MNKKYILKEENLGSEYTNKNKRIKEYTLGL